MFSKYTVNSFRAGLLVEEVESPTVRHNILRFDTLILVCVWAESWNFLPPSNYRVLCLFDVVCLLVMFFHFCHSRLLVPSALFYSCAGSVH